MVPIVLALATSAATLVGGALPLYTRIQRLQQRYLVAVAGGAMVAIALFDLIPEMEAHNAVASDLIPEAHRQLDPGVVAATLAGDGLIPALARLLGG